MTGIRRYLTTELAIQDIDNLDEAQIISIDNTEAIYRVNRTHQTIEPITSPTLGIVPTGTIIAYWGTNVPSGYLPCTGVEYDTEQYPLLYTILQSNKTPDLREIYLCGAGENSNTTIAGHDVIQIHEFKNDQMQGHTHTGGQPLTIAAGGYGLDNGGLWFGNVYNRTLNDYADNGNGTPRIGNVTRPKSIGINYLIRAI